MSRLKVLLRGALINEIELNQEIEYIGGRKEGSDIRLQAEKGISREHFKLKFGEGQWQVQAVSRFGDVFSLGQKVEQAALTHGQSFQIPPYEFQLFDVPESDVSASERGPAVQVSESERTVIGAVPQVPYIKLVNSKGEVSEMLRLEVGDLWVAGRDPSCQIIIPDQRVSRRQFEIHKVNGNYTVLDLASVNGTFLNGSPVSSTDPQTLKSGDVISVLDNSMYFELHDPNFKYKVDRIDVPVMNFNQFAEEYVDQAELDQQFPVEIPDYNQAGQHGDQINTGGGPFTGMPPQSEANQFYTFSPTEATAELTPWQKFTRNKPLVAIAVLLFLAAMYFVSEQINPPEKPVAAAANPNDPLAKLTPAQRKEVQEYYLLADQMMTQQKFDLAIEKLNKVHQLVPEGYKESKKLASEAEQSLLIIAQKQKDDESAKEEEERQAKIIEITKKCEKLLTAKVTTEEMNTCLGPIALIDATHPEYVRLSAAAEKIVEDRKTKEIEKQTQEDRISQLKALFKRAEKIQGEGYAFKAIKIYQQVLASTLPDPDDVKAKAKTRIAYINSKVGDKSARGIGQAEAAYQEGRIKAAVLLLRESLVYDPENQKIKDKIEMYTQELRHRMQVFYQEAIIDESYGMVDSTESKQGAKDKWKKIVELDLDDGEYYKKAVIKLRRYGVR
ncbi:MAG: FHA domain-containing protein [Bdellovibrionaceae bacterium]|nr:FHA domain-containing protein [Bdellovibrio sp.]